MKLTITTLTDIVFTLEVNDEMELENFKALCSLESNIPAERMAVFFNGTVLSDGKKTIAEFGIRDGDMLLVQDLPPHSAQSSHVNAPTPTATTAAPNPFGNLDFSSITIPDSMRDLSRLREEATSIFETLRSNPERVAGLRVNNPRLADAFDKGKEEFCKILSEQQEARFQEEQRRLRMLLADPFDSEAQHMIAEEIRRQQIESNMENAMEYLPESFGEVTMLYIDVKVNGNPIKAFVDSGAQSTIMSKACAERCNILRLIDQRFGGIARGVGTQKILGRIHLVQLEIKNDFIPSSFMILENQPMDMLLGLDMLRRFQCTIDLQKNVLKIGTTGTETPFLHENEIPKSKEAPVGDEESDIQKAIQSSLQHDKLVRRLVALSSAPRPSFPSLSFQPRQTSSCNINTFDSVGVQQMSSGGCGATAGPSNSIAVPAAPSIKKSHPEPVIQELVALGFTRLEVIAELDQSNGDKNQALAALFAKSIKIPSMSM